MAVSEKRLRTLVNEDRKIDQEAQNKTLALMEHRWKAVQEVGSNSEYARALGRHPTLVRKYVKGWEAWQRQQSCDAGVTGGHTPSEILDLANMGEEKKTATEIVATAKGVSTKTVRERHKPDVDRVLNTMRDEPDPEKKVEKATRVAQQVERTRQVDQEHADKRKAKADKAYLDLERELSKTRRSLAMALELARGATLAAEYTELLDDTLQKIGGLLKLVNMAIVGNLEVDWDAELERIA